MVNEIERAMNMLECGNLQPQERHQLARHLVDLVYADEKEGMEEAYILAKIDGDHWRFVGMPIADETQANLECDIFSGEHVVHIMFIPPTEQKP